MMSASAKVPLAAPTAVIAILMPVRPEGLQAIVKLDLAAVVAPEMKCRIKPARHGNEIAGNFPLRDDPALALAVGRDAHRGDAEIAFNG